ncbi:MAG TPA: ATP-binding protein [Acidobacteriaceae bacterium]|nr:ATP-binding protein [Acidobacteriaceae bacterium]
MTAATKRKARQATAKAEPQTDPQVSWPEANQAVLAAEFARLRARLAGKEHPAEAAPATDSPAAVDRLAAVFGLTAFERDVLLLCAGVEMDSALATQCADAQGNSQRAAPTFGLALASLADAHWSALTPASPLRHYRLIEMDASRSLTTAALRIDERILHYIAGINLLDPRLASILVPALPPEAIAEEHHALAGILAPYFAAHPGERSAPSLLMHLFGDDADGQRDTAALAAAQAGRHLFALRAEEVPTDPAGVEQLILLVSREATLIHAALLVECGTADLTVPVRSLIERLGGPVVVSSREIFATSRTVARYEVNKPAPAEQKRLWQTSLGPAAHSLNGFLDNLSGQFRLSARAIHATGSLYADAGSHAIWSSCRAATQPRLEELAQRIVPAATWDALVLPDAQKATLHQIAAQAQHRMKVYEIWGFAARGRRGLGVSALFSGESGTGKTLAAEVLAHELGLDLYRVDLASVVSKYIGETEKNLRQAFDSAEEAGAVLLFDEADALFGKRSDVKDSHDRYANIEVGYLLQRMEAYQGLAILTTNLKSSLDRAFQRRLRFMVDFPFPDVAQREAIWRRAFPAATPTDQINPTALAQLKVPGGSIRNIALNAAFLAAAANRPVGMAQILEAARLEAGKNDRPLADAETRGWV